MLNVTRRTTTCRCSIAYIYCVQQYIPVQQYTCIHVGLRPTCIYLPVPEQAQPNKYHRGLRTQMSSRPPY